MKFRCYLNKDEIKKEYEQLSLYKSPVFKFKYYEIVNLLSNLSLSLLIIIT